MCGEGCHELDQTIFPPRSLAELLEEARKVEMTPDQLEAQRRSFAYGNLKLERPETTREEIDQAAERLESVGSVARYSVSKFCRKCEAPLSEEEQAAKFDECVFCGGVE
jgi:hypothetical protein